MGLTKIALLFAFLAVVAASADEGKTIKADLGENLSDDDDDKLTLRELKALADDEDDDDDRLLDVLARDFGNVPEDSEIEQKNLVKRGWGRRIRRAWRRVVRRIRVRINPPVRLFKK